MDSSVINKLINKKIAIAIVGPTGIGKTKVSLELAEFIPTEIISADARQIYKFMDIGTAKPTTRERTKVPHHFIDIKFPEEDYNAGEFARQAEVVISKLFEANKIPLIVGGSGLYIKALCEGIFDENYSDEERRKALQIRKELSYLSKDALYRKLQEIDPETAKLYPDKNPVRLIRALEFYLVKGIPISLRRKTLTKKPNFRTIYFGLSTNRDILYRRIEQRVDEMWEAGLVEETKRLLQMGYSENLNSLNTVGYKETIQFLKNKLSQTETIELIKRNTRRYAKRQITWFKKNESIIWIDVEKMNVLKLIFNALENVVNSYV